MILGHFPGLVSWVHALFDVIANEADFPREDFLVDFERLFHLLAGHVPTIRSCYGLVLLLKKWRGMRFCVI